MEKQTKLVDKKIPISHWVASLLKTHD